jgi:hypothetical protein
MTTQFKLTGLSAGNRCTLQVGKTDKDWFHAYTNFSRDRFEALFKYFKDGPDDAWKGDNRAIVEHEGFNDSGAPINPVVIEVILP